MDVAVDFRGIITCGFIDLVAFLINNCLTILIRLF